MLGLIHFKHPTVHYNSQLKLTTLYPSIQGHEFSNNFLFKD